MKYGVMIKTGFFYRMHSEAFNLMQNDGSITCLP